MSKKSITNIIFDLDGTLIDSSLGILESFSKTFASFELEPIKPLNSSIIGPPLMETLEMLSGISDNILLKELSEEFKFQYDSIGYQETEVIPGINKMLSSLKLRGYKIYIATNKRIIPTNKIIELFKWNSIFQGIYSLDSFNPMLSSKSVLINTIIKINKLNKENVLYIGDREDDRLAANENNILFEMVPWGFNDFNAHSYSNDNIQAYDLYDKIVDLCE